MDQTPFLGDIGDLQEWQDWAAEEEMEQQRKRILELEGQLVDEKKIHNFWFKKALRLEKELAKLEDGA